MGKFEEGVELKGVLRLDNGKWVFVVDRSMVRSAISTEREECLLFNPDGPLLVVGIKWIDDLESVTFI